MINFWGQPGSEVPFPVTFFLASSSNASNFRLHSLRYFCEHCQLSFSSLSFFFNFSKFSFHVYISFWSFSIIWFSSFSLYKTTKISFSTLIYLFNSSCFGVENFNRGVSSTNLSCSSESSVEITVLVEGNWLSFEDVQVEKETGETELIWLLAIFDESAEPENLKWSISLKEKCSREIVI